MKKIFIPTVLLYVFFVVGCEKTTVSEASTVFCEQMTKLEMALDKADSLGPTSTIKETREAQKEITTSLESLDAAGQDFQQAKVDSLSAARDELDKSINSVSSNDTLAEAAEQVIPKVKLVRAAWQSLDQEIQCN